jgi:predicted secreted Zn-dependent protease
VRAFVRMRELAAVHADLAKRLDELEHKTEGLALAHDTFSRNTRLQLKQLLDAIRELIAPPKRPIGFVAPEAKGSKKTSRARGKT